MYKYLGWKYPETIHYGRLKITGASLSKSKIVQGIREGLYEDWDDPRLATFAALRRRGIRPEAIRKMIIDIGPKTQDVVLSWENLYAYNRKILDASSDRYFFIQDPIELTVRKVPKTFHPKLQVHPEYPERGSREYTIKPSDPDCTAQFWVSKNDLNLFTAGSTIRLMELFNIIIDKANVYSVDATYVSESHDDSKRAKAHLVHWIPVGGDMPCEVMMADASIAQGIAERLCRKLKPDTVVQLERFGFVRVDSNNHKLIAYYGHK
jgi:glutamyl-tRNA synthetase